MTRSKKQRTQKGGYSKQELEYFACQQQLTSQAKLDKFWKDNRVKLHPDKGGNEEQFKILNELHSQKILCPPIGSQGPIVIKKPDPIYKQVIKKMFGRGAQPLHIGDALIITKDGPQPTNQYDNDYAYPYSANQSLYARVVF